MKESSFGDIEALENSEDKEIESWNKRNNMNNAYTERRTREISKQAKNRKRQSNNLCGKVPLNHCKFQ